MVEILTSIEGRRVGLDSTGNLIIAQKQVTDISAEVGAKNGTTVVETFVVDGPMRKVKLTCTATPLVLTDDAGVAVYGGVKVFDFPKGLLLFHGAVVVGDMTTVETLAGWEGDVALGTVTATTGATLVSTEADLMVSNAIAAATAKVGPVDAVSSATQVTESGALWIDGRTTAKDMYLNFVVDEDAANATSTGAFTGTIEFCYSIIGTELHA